MSGEVREIWRPITIDGGVYSDNLEAIPITRKKPSMVKIGQWEIPIIEDKDIHPSQMKLIDSITGDTKCLVVNLKAGFGSRLRWFLYQCVAKHQRRKSK